MRHRFWRDVRRAVGFGVVMGVAAVVLGFVGFAETVAGYEIPSAPMADGIVVLTGGADRMNEALELLGAHRARRLLVSGVHPQTSEQSIERRFGLDHALFDCCVDLDYAATDTASNAVQTARWAHDHHFSSLIVVTSAYHMPRSLSELHHRLPGLTLIAYPVRRAGLNFTDWFNDPGLLRLLLQEYVKYMASETRRILDLD